MAGMNPRSDNRSPDPEGDENRGCFALLGKPFEEIGSGIRSVFERFGTSPRPVHREDPVQTIPAESVEREHEVREVRLRPIIAVAISFLILAVVIHIGLWWVVQGWTGRELRPSPQIAPAAVQPQRVPGPQLQADPVQEFQIYLDLQLEQLSSYGRGEEVNYVRIPINRAMEILVEAGLPARDGDVPYFGLRPAYQLDSQGGQTYRPIFIEE
jgi:hypothetical protein